MPLTPVEEQLAATLGFDPAICDFIKQNMGNRLLERAVCFDDDYDLYESDSISVFAPSAEILAFIDAHRNYLVERSYRPYLGERNTDSGGSKGEELVVLHTDDPYEVIRQRSTNGENYGVSKEDIIARLKEWEQLCRFQILQADASTLHITLDTLPEDLCSFAENAYAFCPDTVDQGVAHMAEDEHPELFAAARELCSNTFTETIEKVTFGTVWDDDESSKKRYFAHTAMGIKLIAYLVQQDKQFLLWWD